MNMKNFYKALFATLIIGLLVMTGCQSPFEPPAGLAAGQGTLRVLINEAGERTILPKAQLDKYELTVTPSAAGSESITKTVKGSTALILAAGSYTIKAEGYVITGIDADDEPIYLKVAEATTESAVTVTAGQASSASLTLNPTIETDGTFAWDFSAFEDITVAIEAYAWDDTAEDFLATDSFTGVTVNLKGDKVLTAGVYNVKFTVSDDTPVVLASWWEILYIYGGLTSAYDFSETSLGLIEDLIPTVPYNVSVAGVGYFYLDLNDWRTIGDSSINDVRPVAVTAANNIKVNFTQNNQRINFGLSGNQVALLQASTDFKTTIVGTSDKGTSNFRYHIGDATLGGGWNVSNGSGEKPFADFLDATTGPTTQTIDANGLSKIKHFILQCRAAAENNITITSIRIDYTLYSLDGKFELDLNDAQVATTGVTAWNIKDSAVAFTVDGDGVLGATFTEQYQRLNFALPDITDIVAVDGNTTFADWAAVDKLFVTITGTATPDTRFRYHLGDPTTDSNWNATGGAGDTAFSNLASPWVLSVANPERGLDFLILNYYDSNTSVAVSISKIEISYKLKPVWVAPPAATGPLNVITSAAPVTITGPWGQWGNIQIPLTISWPTGLKPGSYKSFTLTMVAYDSDDQALALDTNIQFWFTSSSTEYYGTRLGQADFANGRSAATYVKTPLVAGEYQAETIAGIYAQPKTASVAKVVITEFTLHHDN